MKDFLTIAKIVKPQGIRGEVKVVAMTDSPEDLKGFGGVYIAGNRYKMLKVRPQEGGCAIVALSGVADRNAAELLRGEDILALREEAPPLPDGTYYIVDLIGCTALTDGGKKLGVISSITPARTDVYEVEKEEGGKLIFPAVEGVIASVDLAAKEVVLSGKKLAEVALEEK